MLPDISDFNFGQSKSFELTLEEPPARPAVVYTAWHVWRVLQHHKRDIQAGKKNYTVTPILKAFQVPCLPHLSVTPALLLPD